MRLVDSVKTLLLRIELHPRLGCRPRLRFSSHRNHPLNLFHYQLIASGSYRHTFEIRFPVWTGDWRKKTFIKEYQGVLGRLEVVSSRWRKSV
jgi:hypothetical protein